jgi:MFS family permease
VSALKTLAGYRVGFRIAVAAATIGVIYGYDLGNISGALLFITKEFDLTTKQTEWVATIVVAGSIAGALVASRLANAIGAQADDGPGRATLRAVRGPVGLAPASSGSTSRASSSGHDRLSIVTAPIFVAESAPAAVRGGLIVMYQVATVTGIVIAYFVDYALAARRRGGSCSLCRRAVARRARDPRPPARHARAGT